MFSTSSPGSRDKSFQQDNLSSSGSLGSGEVDFGLSFFPDMKIGGLGRRLGAEIRIFEESSWISADQLPNDVFLNARNDYGDINNPVITNPQPEIPFMMEAGYTLNNTRVGLSWSRISASHNQSGEVPGYFAFEGANSSEFSYGFVSLWNMGWDLHASRNFPATWYEGYIDRVNDQIDVSYFPKRGLSRYNISHEIKLNSFEFSVQHPVIQNENLKMELIGGLHHGRWQNDLIQTLDITFHGEITERRIENIWDENVADSISVEAYLTTIMHNDITLETISSIKYNPFGLIIGMETEWNVFPFLSFLLKASTSRLSGDASVLARGTDVDDIVENDNLVLFNEEGDMIYSDALTGTEYLSGEFELPESSWSISSVNYKFNFSAKYDINNMFSLTAGYFYTLCKDLPMSSQWSYSDQFTYPFGAFALETSWDTDIRSDISNSGFVVGIGFRF